MGMEEILHIFAQFHEHGDAKILGNKSGLLALRDAINTALSEKRGEAQIMADDGEGYSVMVEMTNGAGLRKAGSHYVQRQVDGIFAAEREYYLRTIETQSARIRSLRPLPQPPEPT